MKNTLENIINKAISSGAEEADVIITSGNSIKAKSENLEISDYSVNSSLTIGVRVIKNHKVGISYCETIENDSLDFMINQALKNSQFSTEEPLLSINVKQDKDINGTKPNHTTSKTDPRKIINQAITIEKKNRSYDDRVKTPLNIAGEIHGGYYYLNHLGTYCYEHSKTVYGSTSIILEDGEKNSTYSQIKRANQFHDVDFTSLSSETYKHASKLLEGKQIPTGVYNVVFTPDTLSSLLNSFSNIFSGYAVTKDLNPFKDKLKTLIASPLLTIIDQPRKTEGTGFSIFDSEGNTTADLTLIKNGVLNAFYQNSLTSKILNTKNTHNAHRSPKGKLGTSGTNKVIMLGENSKEDFQKEKYFEVVKIQGLNSGHNNITGDYSFAASGYLIKKGEIQQVVKGVTISGNFFETLKKISLVSNKLHSSSGQNFFSPQILFSDIKIGGR